MVQLWTQQKTGKRMTLKKVQILQSKFLNFFLNLLVFKPFCDGSHKTRGQGMTPVRFVPEKDSTVWLCGCKHTNNPPYCDGTHKQDFIASAPLHEYTD